MMMMSRCFLWLVLLNHVGGAILESQAPHRELQAYRDCPGCTTTTTTSASSVSALHYDPDLKDVNIVATYSDHHGNIRLGSVKMGHLSSSWLFDNPLRPNTNPSSQDSFQNDSTRMEENAATYSTTNQSGETDNHFPHMEFTSPAKLKRQSLRQERRAQRTLDLIQHDKESDHQMQEAAIHKSITFENSVVGKYSIWRRDYESPNADAILKLMRDQIIMAKAYSHIAKSKNATNLYLFLMQQSRENQRVLGKATSDADLPSRALEQAKAMGHALSLAKDELYDCHELAKKFRAMLQSTERNVDGLKKKGTFLIQLAAKTFPKPLHCLSLQLAADYFLLGFNEEEDGVKKDAKFEDPSLYHYAIFSDNVLATSVVVNSTVLNAKEPEKHVFHIVTDKLNFAAMKMWFRVNAPTDATIQVENINDFKWLNSSYCSVLRQLESARLKEYYFKANHPSSISAGADNLKYRNPKYLSMLNHLRFYLPEVYPKLDKILFLDDDIVVQKDLAPLWEVDMQGKVNGAVETCKESFHRFDKYLNFSNPKISENFDAGACGWAFGMNMFDLREWRKRNITGIYHYWQDMNEDRTLWKLGSLPPGLITFYNLTYAMERSWHVLGLGYDPALNQTAIENAAVVHYNGNYKPWLGLAFAKYKPYWSKYVEYDNPYLRLCNINE
ncbi:probable galacturonosyltransferase 3 isoform X2 [Raphanus sativus]|uniref:Hexosyltransferase n=1 Tax=Raphanus sativus TaxID=3726 RepID=A0A9W3CZW0_RAPSA|nr:probable galacturonosyltransferase 3 isoform X2 [Raphanus sativus]XP_056857124.1 probable galacturonosyltransferase 3 isoform X2 [Raphanus sativus]